MNTEREAIQKMFQSSLRESEQENDTKCFRWAITARSAEQMRDSLERGERPLHIALRFLEEALREFPYQASEDKMSFRAESMHVVVRNLLTVLEAERRWSGGQLSGE